MNLYLRLKPLFTLLVCLSILTLSCGKSENSPEAPTPVPPTNNLTPTITSISSASLSFARELTINGTKFSTVASENIVKINGKQAFVKSSTENQLVVLIPKGAGSGNISLTINGNTVTGPSFTYVPSLLISVLAGSGVSGSSDGIGTAARFGYNYGVVIDNNDNLFVADGGNKIRKITQSGVVSTYSGSEELNITNGPIGSAEFAFISDMAIDKENNVYVIERYDRSVRKISSTGIVTTVVKIPTKYLLNIATDAQNNVYVYSDDKTIVKLNPNGAITNTYGPFNSLDQQIRNFKIDSKGDFYFMSYVKNIVYKAKVDGTSSIFAGTDGVQGSVDGIGTAAQFQNVEEMLIDKNDNIYVYQRGFQNIMRKITPDGTVSTIFPNGMVYTMAVDDLGRPTGIGYTAPSGKFAIDTKGNFYICDFNTFKILKYQAEQ